MLVRALLLSLFLSSTAHAATTYKVPFTVVPGSVTSTPAGYATSSTPIPVSFPVSGQAVADSTVQRCTVGLVSVAPEIVNDGIEFEIDGYSIGSGCTLGGRVEFEMEIQVPELGGTTTSALLVSTPLSFSFIDYRRVRAEMVRLGTCWSSASPETPIRTSDNAPTIRWDGDNPGPISDPTELVHWIPGDTIRFPVSIEIRMDSDATHNAQGAARVRYEYRVTVPEPSAALPIGVPTLAGLASIRGR